MERNLYLPIPFVEALGRASIARAQLELSLDLLVTAIALEPTRLRTCHPRDSFETKVEYLETISRSRLVKHDWWRRIRRIASSARALHDQFSAAAMGSVYSRGGGYLEELMRPLAEKLRVSSPSLSMTPRKIDAIAEQSRAAARDACELAVALLSAAERLSIAPGDRQS